MSVKVKRQIHAHSTRGTMKTFEFITGSPNPTAARPFWSWSNGPNPSTPLRFTLRKASRPSCTVQRHDMCWLNVLWCSSAHEKIKKNNMMHAACDSFWKWFIDIVTDHHPPHTRMYLLWGYALVGLRRGDWFAAKACGVLSLDFRNVKEAF